MNRLIPIFLILLIISCDFQDEPSIPESPWELAHPSEVGLDEERLLTANTKIKDGIYGGIKSLIIVKNDKLVFENYYNSSDRNLKEDISGGTVAVSSIAAGILLDQGIVTDINTPISDLLTDQTPFEDPLRAQITYRHLISMRTGIAWNELLRPPNDPQNSAAQMVNQSDWADFTLNQTMEAVPGGRFAYSSGAAMVFSKIVRENTGRSLEEFVQEHVFDPLQIEYSWISDPSGSTTAGWGLRITPRSMAKIGYMALNGGTYFGTRIVSREYTDEMGALQSQFTFNNDFGYGWWRFSDFNQFVSNLEKNDIYFSWGTGGQFIFVIPHLDMVVTTTATNFAPDANEQVAFNLLFDDIISSIREEL